jgi:hypothetical protein
MLLLQKMGGYVFALQKMGGYVFGYVFDVFVWWLCICGCLWRELRPTVNFERLKISKN